VGVYVCVCVWCAHAFVSFVNLRREPGGTGEIAREREQERWCTRERSHETVWYAHVYVCKCMSVYLYAYA